MSRRTDRLNELLLEELARVLREEVQDPRLRLVNLTRVDVAPDLSHARVHFSAFDSERIPEIQRGLDRAAGFLRTRLARALDLKRMPELRFEHDESIERGSMTLSLLQELADESQG